MEKSDKLKKILGEVAQIATTLRSDFVLLEKKTTHAVDLYNRGNLSRKELCFWHKALVRVFLAQIEGLSYTMREHVYRFSPELGVEWSKKKWGLISAQDSHLSIEKSLSLAFGSFSRLFGANFSLDRSGEDYRGFTSMLEARDRFTHPWKSDDLCPCEIFITTSSSMEWVLQSWRALLVICADSLELPFAAGVSPERRFQYKDESTKKLKDLAEPEERGFVDELARMIHGLTGETTLAIQTLSKSFASDAEIGVNCAARLLVATMFSEIEGSVFIAASHLHRFGVGYPKPSKELLIGDHAEVQARIVSTLESFSAKFGTTALVLKEGAGWDSFVIGREVRNRLTHPKKPEDLIVTMEELQSIMKTSSWWHGDVHRCLELS